jgi:serine O-acetyltransferase
LLDKNIWLTPEEFAIYIYRLQNQIISLFGESECKKLLDILSYIQRMYTQMEIYYTAVIGDCFKIIHGLGTVIGARVIVGNEVTVYQNVTLGDRGQGDKGRPIIGDGTIIGAGSKIFGNIQIGRHCIIGANSVVLHSFPDFSTIAGAPARLIKTRDQKSL